MRQEKKASRKTRRREKNQAKRNAEPFIGTCSSCGDKEVSVTKFKSAQICVKKCLVKAIGHLSTGTQVSPDQVIKAV
jgi:transcription elongation factor Elf1